MLSDVVKEFSCRNKDLRVQKVYSVTNSDGFMPSQDYFSKDVFSKDLSNYKIVRKGMLAYNPSRINVGSVACLQSEDEVIVSPLYVVVEVNEKKLLAEYLNLFLHSDIALEQIKSLTSGSVRDSLKYNAFTRLCLPIPTVEMQRAVIKKLNAIKKLIVKREQQLSKLDQLAKSRFIEMFGDPVTNPKRWEKISLSNICNIGSSKRIFEREYVSHGIPFYRTKELVERAAGEKIATELFISIERFNEIKAKFGTPQKNDLLISAVGTIGVIWIVDETQFYFKDGNILRIEASENFNSIFLKFVLEQLIREYKKQMSAGTAYAALTIVNLKKMEIFDIPLELQNEFAAFIEQLDKSKLADQIYEVAA